jgi:hypothetical protein
LESKTHTFFAQRTAFALSYGTSRIPLVLYWIP